MKLILFTYKGKKGKRHGRSGTNFERILAMSFVFTFVLVILVQSALTNSSVREFLSVNADLEGAPLEGEMYLYSEGVVSLGLAGQNENSNVKVLVNGEEVAVFSTSVLQINVKDGDVIEVDGSKFTNSAEVEILSKSENISNQCVGKKVKVQSNTRKLVKINMNH